MTNEKVFLKVWKNLTEDQRLKVFDFALNQILSNAGAESDSGKTLQGYYQHERVKFVYYAFRHGDEKR